MSAGGGFFGSGGKTSAQKTQNSNNVTTTNVSGGASDNAWNVSSSGAVTLTDPNLIENAFRFASESLGLIERSTSASQQQFEKAFAQTLGIADSAKTGSSERLLWLAGLGLAAVVGVLYVMRH